MKLSKEALQKMIQEELGFLREQGDYDYAVLADAVIDWISESLGRSSKKLDRLMKQWEFDGVMVDPTSRNIAGPKMEIHLDTQDGPKVVTITATVEGHDR